MATATTPDPEAPDLLPVAEAARALGVSVSAVRRGLKSGRYRGQRQATPQGFVWLVQVGGDRVPGDRRGEHRVPDLRVVGDRVGGDRRPEASQEGPGGALLAARAQEMAAYTERLLAPYVKRIEEQAEEIGALKAQLAAREEPAPQTESAPSPEWEARRWWQRLLWG